MVIQLETAVKAVDDRVFKVRRELEWIFSDKRAACGLQVLTSGWPTGLKPESRRYMLGWMLAEAQGQRQHR